MAAKPTKGLEVHGFDSSYPGHPNAGSGGDSRLFWNLEFAEPQYVPLIRRAATAWNSLEKESGALLRDQTGVLLLGEEGNAQLELAYETSDPQLAPVNVLSASELRQRFPQFHLDDNTIGIWDINGSAIRPELTNQVTAQLAERQGATIHEFTAITAIDYTADTVRLSFGSRVESFDKVVIACGGWTTKLLPELKTEVVTRRLTSVWFTGQNDSYLADLPPFMRAAPNYTYGIPGHDGRSVKLGLGFNDHHVTADPDTLRRNLTGKELEENIMKFDWVREQILPRLAPRPYRVSTFVESYTRSMMEYVRPHPETDNILVLTGFSGHGFRVAPAIGEIAAELVLSGQSSTDVSFLARATPAFNILDVDKGITSYNPVMASRNTPAGDSTSAF